MSSVRNGYPDSCQREEKTSSEIKKGDVFCSTRTTGSLSAIPLRAIVQEKINASAGVSGIISKSIRKRLVLLINQRRYTPSFYDHVI